MTWVRRQQPRHECAPPTTGDIPAIGAAGNIGDLWRCECGRLWRVTDANHGTRGRVIHGKTWRPATLWQRLRYAGVTRNARTEDPWPEVDRCLRCGQRAQVAYIATTELGTHWVDLCAGCNEWLIRADPTSRGNASPTRDKPAPSRRWQFRRKTI